MYFISIFKEYSFYYYIYLLVVIISKFYFPNAILKYHFKKIYSAKSTPKFSIQLTITIKLLLAKFVTLSQSYIKVVAGTFLFCTSVPKICKLFSDNGEFLLNFECNLAKKIIEEFKFNK